MNTKKILENQSIAMKQTAAQIRQEHKLEYAEYVRCQETADLKHIRGLLSTSIVSARLDVRNRNSEHWGIWKAWLEKVTAHREAVDEELKKRGF